MGEAEQLAKFKSVVSFYAARIEERINKGDFDFALTWYREMCGAHFLADRLGIPVDHRQADEWFERIQTARYGQRRST